MTSSVTCKCVKSKCLQLYCECYRQGITCKDDCVCIDCRNTVEHARASSAKKRRDDRDRGHAAGHARHDHASDDCCGGGGEAGTGTAERVFKMPQLAPTPSRRHRALEHAKAKSGSGCSCKNSNCLKKYCVCFNAGVECNVGRCNCINCKNPRGSISAADLAGPGAEDAGDDVAAAATRCRCTRTRCLKLYCDCFRQDLLCNAGCDCVECKNTVEYSGPTGDRTRAKAEIIKTRPHVFNTPKKKTGVGCSCLKNKCRTKYCDCNSRGVGCDPAVCTCINCENMMKPLSEAIDDGLQPIDEDPTEVFAPNEDHKDLLRCSIKGLHNFSHLIDDFEEGRRIADPSEKVSVAYAALRSAAEAARKVVAEESWVRGSVQEEIRRLESQLRANIKDEDEALEDCREKTNRVMCLEMEEPCRWNSTYRQLKAYVMRTGDLPPVPSACAAEVDRRLSIWVQEMKSLVYSKSERMTNAPHRIEALESLGIEWIESSEDRWNKMYGSLRAYKRRNGTVKLPSFMQCRKSKDKDLAALRHWVDSQEAEVKSGAMAKRRDRLRKLQDLGLPLSLTWEQEWEHYGVELLKFRSKYGHLNVAASGDDDGARSDLALFVSRLLERLKKGGSIKLTRDELHDLAAKGLLGDLKVMNSRPPGRPPSSGGGGARLVPVERVKEVNYWAGMLEQLRAYKAETGTLSFPPHRGGAPSTRKGNNDHAHLRDWVEAQRRGYENRTLEESRIRELRNLGLEFDPWNVTFGKLRKFKREAGTVRLPKEYRSNETDEDGREKRDAEVAMLCKWVQEQVRLYRKGELESERKKKLRKLGVYLTKGHMGKVPWETRFEEMIEYYHTNKTCLPKRDGPLRQWVVELVDLIQNGFVSAKRQRQIDRERIGPHLRPEVIFEDRVASSASAGGKKRKAAEASPSDDASGDDAKRIRTEAMAAV
mmetsp:Transcript_42990/g.91412  ORF Transcript_42990/g.91412 Transcript_42990/m.91412 type:complete len:933 (+) Transcript_42990:300-3098(+)